MIVAQVDPLNVVAVVTASLAALAGGYATIQARRTERRSASREETQQALNAQSALLDRYEKRIERLEARNTTLHEKVNDALGKLNIVSEEHKICQDRLRKAETRLAELGG